MGSLWAVRNQCKKGVVLTTYGYQVAELAAFTSTCSDSCWKLSWSWIVWTKVQRSLKMRHHMIFSFKKSITGASTGSGQVAMPKGSLDLLLTWWVYFLFLILHHSLLLILYIIFGMLAFVFILMMLGRLINLVLPHLLLVSRDFWIILVGTWWRLTGCSFK